MLNSPLVDLSLPADLGEPEQKCQSVMISSRAAQLIAFLSKWQYERIVMLQRHPGLQIVSYSVKEKSLFGTDPLPP